MGSHSLFNPSSAEIWLVCGYHIKMKRFYISTDNAASKNGTKHHEIAALHLINGTDSSIKGMDTYLNTVRQSAMDGELFVERKVVIVKDMCEGTLDAGIIAHDRTWGRIVDLKWGTGAVHATNNPQEKTYAIGLLAEYPLPPDAPMQLSIVQPNGKSGWPVKNWDTDVRTILKFKDEVHRAIDNGLSPHPKAVAGSHCYWCPVKPHCRAYLLYRGKK